jgi:glycosyltransferase involved in cell wall biosynthesis
MGKTIPAISVVMPLYNKGHEVGRAIQSVLAQTFADYELLVVDDGSTDSGPDIVTACDDPRIRMIRQENAGVSAARNRGIAEARAELIAFLDADDEWYPEFLSKIISLTENYPEANVYATTYWMQKNDGSKRKAVLKKIGHGFLEGLLNSYFLIAAYSEPPLFSSAVAVNKDAFNAIGGFPVGIQCGEDLLTWARLASQNSIAFSTDALSIFHEPYDISYRKHRFPDDEDVVGKGLQQLCVGENEKVANEIRTYIARWNKMRAHAWLAGGMKSKARNEIKKAMKSDGLNFKVLIMWLISYLPQPIVAQILK